MLFRSELAATQAPAEDSSLLSGEDVEMVFEELELEIPEAGTFTPYEVAPQAIVNPAPDYPEMAKTAGVKGKVEIGRASCRERV